MADNKVLMATNFDKPVGGTSVQTVTPAIPAQAEVVDVPPRQLLQAPDTIQVVIPDTGSVRQTNEPSSVVHLLAHEPRVGRRQKLLPTENVAGFKTAAEGQAFAGIAAALDERVKVLQ